MLIQNTIQFVKNAHFIESGHDFYHIERVWKLALNIAKKEQKQNSGINIDLVQVGALLHDIADHKFHNGDETIGPKIAREFLLTQEVSEEFIQQVVDIITQISYKGAQQKDFMNTLEGRIVQDADRLDAIGAIGIARCFNYGGHAQRYIFDPNEKPQQHKNAEEYKKSKSSSINHFYEKLLLLKDRMNTESGKQIALQRHQYMVDYLERFYQEWQGEL